MENNAVIQVGFPGDTFSRTLADLEGNPCEKLCEFRWSWGPANSRHDIFWLITFAGKAFLVLEWPPDEFGGLYAVVGETVVKQQQLSKRGLELLEGFFALEGAGRDLGRPCEIIPGLLSQQELDSKLLWI